ncbi:branched-chain amino acid transport system substrate-binding protein [Bradyrhizobium japonicum]
MRGLLACTLLAAITSAAMTTAARAQVSDDAVRIGVLTDLSSWGRDNSGPGSVEAAKMAVEEFGPTVLGKPIEIISADHQMKTDVGVQIVRGWFDNGKVDAVVDIPNSGIAIAVHNMVRERNKIALLSGPGASSLTDELCSPNTVHFTYDTYALSKVTASAVIKEGGKSWYFITADYAFGQQLEKDATRFINEMGGKVLGGVKHPTNTADFSSFALQAQSSKSDVVAFANAGQDTDNAIKQSGEFGLVQGGQKLVGLLMFDTDVHAIGLKAAQGTYMTTASYWNMDEATRAWSKKFYERTKVMPTMIQTGVYGSVLHYLKGIKAAGRRPRQGDGQDARAADRGYLCPWRQIARGRPRHPRYVSRQGEIARAVQGTLGLSGNRQDSKGRGRLPPGLRIQMSAAEEMRPA